MVTNFHLPPSGFGPGSQQSEDGAELDYMALPSGMRTYAPHIPETPEAVEAGVVLARLDDIARACKEASETGLHAEFDLTDLTPSQRALMAETLGQGEVSMKLLGVPALRVQESVFAGVWVLDGHGIDRVEVAPVPSAAIARAHFPHRVGKGADAPRPEGIANAPALMEELLDKSRSFSRGQEPHVINLTLLPHTEPDLVWLDEALGEGAVTILSRGYGNCRLTATALAHVWRVQFFNSMDTLILDTFEVTEMPEVAFAAPEDLADSSERIMRVCEAIA